MRDVFEEPLVVVDRVFKSFDGHPVLNGVSLSVVKGELISIIGPSGCGKSTLLRCLNGLETMDSGSIQIDGVGLTQDGDRPLSAEDYFNRAHRLRGEVGMVFQSFNLFPHRTILQNIMAGPVIVKRVPKEEAEEKARHLLKKVGLGEFGDRYPEYLSGGQKQRAAIARALAMSPKVMLYDEPTSALDPELVDEVLAVMKELDAEGMTQIVVTHEIRFARDASDYIVYMESGEIVEISDEDQIFTQPKDERTRRFLRKFL
jgi:polar amino acid transport system ATP-binding protein